jgi:hypothetical protein
MQQKLHDLPTLRGWQYFCFEASAEFCLCVPAQGASSLSTVTILPTPLALSRINRRLRFIVGHL